MSQQMSNKKFVMLTAIIIAVSAGIGLTIPNMISASVPQDNAKTPEENHSPDSTETGGVMVGKGLRTKDNTNCVNPPGGPMIC